MATFDAFALGAMVAERTTRAALTIGPLAVAVRDPVMIAMGAGLAGRADRADGERGARLLQPGAGPAVARPPPGAHRARAGRVGHRRPDPAGRRQGRCGRGEVIRTRGFRLRTKAPGTPLTIAAFGRGAVKVAARHADRMVINLVTPKSAARLVEMLHEECRAAGRPVPPVAAWVAAVVGPVIGPPGRGGQARWRLRALARRVRGRAAAAGPGRLHVRARLRRDVRRGRVSRTWCASPGPGRIRGSCWRRSRRRSSGTCHWSATRRTLRARLAEYAERRRGRDRARAGSSDADPAGVAYA